jgi:hypothetical protein
MQNNERNIDGKRMTKQPSIAPNKSILLHEQLIQEKKDIMLACIPIAFIQTKLECCGTKK